MPREDTMRPGESPGEPTLREGAPSVFNSLPPPALERDPFGWKVFILGVICILVIGCLDFYTGPQVSASLFYMLPVLFVSHYAGRAAGVLAALTATAVWLWADLAGSEGFVHPLIPYWNALMRLGVFLVVAWIVSAMRSLNATLEKRVQDRTARLEAEVQERTKLEKRILEISDREQARIGQDLHDGLCQHLVGTTFSACRLQERLAARGLPEAADAAQLAARLDESITQARGVARGLHPVPLEELGLSAALQELLDGVAARNNLSCSLECLGAERALTSEDAIHLYRITQEAVTNALKHATPHKIHVRLRLENGGFELQVDDDGKGVEPATPRGGGMGLAIMAYRARMIGATFAVEGRTGGGTRVICRSDAAAKLRNQETSDATPK
jgi:signal transduction histidine kinase